MITMVLITLWHPRSGFRAGRRDLIMAKAAWKDPKKNPRSYIIG